MTDPVLQVRDLSVAFRSKLNDGPLWRPVVHGVSFDVGRRETVALVGESGSGKSVTSMAVMRLLDPRETRVTGDVRLEGVDLLALPEEEMRCLRSSRVSMVFQEPMTSLNPVRTIGDQVAETFIVHQGMSKADAWRKVVDLFDQVRIPKGKARLEDYPYQFSGGMRQRVLIAMALAGDPALLIADEPTTALDVTVQARILDLLRDLQRDRDMSILFITHDMGVVAQMADRTVVLYKGDIVEEGETGRIFASPRQAYTRALLAAVPRLGSMQGSALPQRTPLIDKVTGEAQPVAPSITTVDCAAEPVLIVKNLTKRYDVRGGPFNRVTSSVQAVRGISLEVRAGETLSIVGESGCGKSTLGRSIIRLEEPTSGQVIFNGGDFGQLRRKALKQARADIQMIFQDPYASLNPTLPVAEAIIEPMMATRGLSRAAARARAEELLVLVGLDAASGRRLPREFSGGQRQRISIARALALDPKLIIADEAVSALDVSVKAQVINLMLDLQEKMGLAYLFISHDMAVVERISHRVAVMLAGRILEIGPRSAIFENPQHPYTRQLLAAVPLADPSARSARLTPETEYRTFGNLGPDEDIDGPSEFDEVAEGHFVQVGATSWQASTTKTFDESISRTIDS